MEKSGPGIRDKQSWIRNTAFIQQFRIHITHHCNANPASSFHFNADPDPTFNFNADPVFFVPHQSDENLRSLVYKPQRLYFEPPLCIHGLHLEP
jgi:hypothetical protein